MEQREGVDMRNGRRSLIASKARSRRDVPKWEPRLPFSRWQGWQQTSVLALCVFFCSALGACGTNDGLSREATCPPTAAGALTFLPAARAVGRMSRHVGWQRSSVLSHTERSRRERNPELLAVAAGESQRRLYVLGDHVVLVMDAETGGIVATIPVGDPAFVGPRSLTAARGRVYTVVPGGGEITMIDTATNAISGAIQVPCCTVSVSASPDGAELYVLTEELRNYQVIVVDTSTNQWVRTISLGSEVPFLTDLLVVDPAPAEGRVAPAAGADGCATTPPGNNGAGLLLVPVAMLLLPVAMLLRRRRSRATLSLPLVVMGTLAWAAHGVVYGGVSLPTRQWVSMRATTTPAASSSFWSAGTWNCWLGQYAGCPTAGAPRGFWTSIGDPASMAIEISTKVAADMARDSPHRSRKGVSSLTRPCGPGTAE